MGKEVRHLLAAGMEVMEQHLLFLDHQLLMLVVEEEEDITPMLAALVELVVAEKAQMGELQT
jgi:hypothetical protein